MEHQEKKIYCSLDIETSGFDPVNNEILEIGLAFFAISEQGLKITDEYTKVFKPKGPVPANILGLTGIRQKELDEAGAFEDYRDEIQAKLKDAVILGHNVIFDIKFLQGKGLEFSGEVIDTLDLVQFILPTHHSYNLENLMHSFGIAHKQAHRALADSKASVKVLERLLQIYSGFPQKLKQEISSLIAPYQVPYKFLLELSLPPQKFEPPKAQFRAAATGGVNFKAGTIYNFPLGQNFVETLAASAKPGNKILLVVPRQQQVIALWEKQRGEPVFAPEQQFNQKKFGTFLSRGNFSADELKFLMKILVWQHTNWQSQYIWDLNLSFFGGQFRSLISGGSWPPPVLADVAACDQETFLQLAEKKAYSDRLVVMVGLSDLETAISQSAGSKVSWGYISYLLRSIYNPESGGDLSRRQVVEEMLAASDLFFGLVHMLLHGEGKNFQYLKLTEDFLQSGNMQKVAQAAANYAQKLKAANEQLRLEEIGKFAEKLASFFQMEDNTVKWIELAEKRCVLFSSPLEITKLVKDLLLPYARVCVADSLGQPMVLNYFLSRLGLSGFALQQPNPGQPLKKQGDLFVKPAVQPVACSLKSQKISDSQLLELLSADCLPAAVVFGANLQVKQFYEGNYLDLKSRAFLLSQSASGGNRIFRNFSIHNNSLLVATDRFILKYLQSSGAGVEHLPVKTLVLCHLPFEQFSHPYQETLSQQFANPFIDYSLPKAVYNFHSLLDFFYTAQLRQVYVYDDKLAKDYATAFVDCLNLLPQVVIS